MHSVFEYSALRNSRCVISQQSLDVFLMKFDTPCDLSFVFSMEAIAVSEKTYMRSALGSP
jgi:hypothetical protein